MRTWSSATCRPKSRAMTHCPSSLTQCIFVSTRLIGDIRSIDARGRGRGISRRAGPRCAPRHRWWRSSTALHSCGVEWIVPRRVVKQAAEKGVAAERFSSASAPVAISRRWTFCGDRIAAQAPSSFGSLARVQGGQSFSAPCSHDRCQGFVPRHLFRQYRTQRVVDAQGWGRN